VTRLAALRTAGLAGAAVAAAGLLLAAPGEMGGAAARACLVVGTLAAAAVLAGRRLRPSAQAALQFPERQLLCKESGVAVAHVEGRRLLLGFGPAGVTLLADLGKVPGEPR